MTSHVSFNSNRWRAACAGVGTSAYGTDRAALENWVPTSPVVDDLHLLAGLLELAQAAQAVAQDGKSSSVPGVDAARLTVVGISRSDLQRLVNQGLVVAVTVPQENGAGDSGGSKRQRKSRRPSSRDARYIATDKGMNFLRALLRLVDRQFRPAIASGGAASNTVPSLSPCWDASRRELRVGETIVKSFHVPAPLQELILAAFEEEGWPHRIDSPIPGPNAKSRTRNAVTSLNQAQQARLIRFRGDGTGEGVLWELSTPATQRGS